MPVTLGTNIPSYNARVKLNSAVDNLTKTMEKLSSGYKINRAGDDAAGLVISQNMEATIRGSKQAQANIQTATSFLSVAEDGMVTIGDHLQRINDLLTNMANGTNDIDSNTAAVREIIERLEEIDRLSETTNFNGRQMLNGSTTDIVVQMGSDASEYSILDISKALTNCHVEQLDVELPAYLNPDAKIKDDDVIIPVEVKQDDGSYKTEWYKQDATKHQSEWEKCDDAGTDEEIAKLESAFDPSNTNCRLYMAKVQDCIADLTAKRGLLGAYENRMQSSYDMMSSRIESLESAKTVYTDTDIAQESTEMTRLQIMQQLNVAVLSQANMLQQTALQLLGG